MSRFLVRAALAAVCVLPVFIGCQENVIDMQSSAEMVRLEISVPISETKVISGADETAVKNYQVFLFNEQEVLEAYVNKSTADLSLNATLGLKTVVVLLNAPAINDITDLTELLSKKSLLSHNAPDAFVMEGLVNININTTKNVSVEVPVSRKVAKVELANVTAAFELPQYQTMPFKVSSVYLINVPADAKYLVSSAPSQWFNQSQHVASEVDNLIYDDMKSVVVSPESPYSTKNAFYCYPNPTAADSFSKTWTARRTRLVVEAMLGDQKYYYPVTLPKLESNKIYQVSLTITRPGSLSPDSVVDKFAAAIAVSITDWADGGTVTEDI
jgi:hypothetical protein